MFSDTYISTWKKQISKKVIAPPFGQLPFIETMRLRGLSENQKQA